MEKMTSSTSFYYVLFFILIIVCHYTAKKRTPSKKSLVILEYFWWCIVSLSIIAFAAEERKLYIATELDLEETGFIISKSALINHIDQCLNAQRPYQALTKKNEKEQKRITTWCLEVKNAVTNNHYLRLSELANNETSYSKFNVVPQGLINKIKEDSLFISAKKKKIDDLHKRNANTIYEDSE